ncbi:hypothetical protein [Xanthomonas phage Xp15]|uniref:Uncharacterized protein n=1 Tax=Xanthomonas phage Xp15 TaxID=322855 RepID=Q52PS2_9CAUD|nr:hypothetical protein XPXV15_gp50 [Xanthomonas phage Xp15]AAX84886.1 hypothetical protein [Xanthomonas phage Xp15]
MKLSPAYVRFVSEMVSILLAKYYMLGMDHLTTQERSLLIAFALVCLNKDVMSQIMEALENHGELPCKMWIEYVEFLRVHNDSGVQTSEDSVNQILEKFRDQR